MAEHNHIFTSESVTELCNHLKTKEKYPNDVLHIGSGRACLCGIDLQIQVFASLVISFMGNCFFAHVNGNLHINLAPWQHISEAPAYLNQGLTTKSEKITWPIARTPKEPTQTPPH